MKLLASVDLWGFNFLKSMIALSNCNRLIDEGFSLVTVGENKIPNFPWKKYQTEKPTKSEFKKNYEYSGGIIKKDGDEIKPTSNIGIITGFDFIECIDIDLKVFSTAKEQIEFWNELLSFLKDNIYDFDDKFVIYKTQNAGYHIIYKSKRVTGNKKIAALKGHKEAVIESRGIGGYIFIYEGKNVTDKTYKDVQFITDEDRDILWSCCCTYNHIDETPVIIPKEDNKTFQESGLKPWEDYNQRTSILELLQGDFDVVRTLKDKYVIKRLGATSPHSGYVYKDSGCMYLFSSGTIYPQEILHSPFAVYTIKYHGGNFSQAAKKIYQDGFGERIKPKPVIEKEKINIPEKDLMFPVDIFPEVLQKYISASSSTLNNSVDYMGCSLLFIASVIIGNCLVVEVKNGWQETANLWLALVGRAGVGKTPSINSITFPLEKSNNKEIKAFIKNLEKYDAYKALDPESQKLTEEIKKPKKSQFIVNDITLEALIEMHGENKNGIGVLKDELAGWFKDMNKYRQGSDLEHWLSSWSGKQINLNRKTARSSFVQRAFIPVLGGIQPSIMDSFYTEENKDNGFVDRMLFCYPDLTVELYSEKEMKQEYLDWYNDYVVNFYETIKGIIKYTEDFEIEPYIARFSPEARKEWVRIFNEITNVQNDDNENEYMKSMLPKQKSYIPRFSLIINTLESNENPDIILGEISKESVLKAEKLSKYFIAMAKKIKSESSERQEIKTSISSASNGSPYEKFVSIYSKNKDIKKKDVADILNVSRTMIYKYITMYDEAQRAAIRKETFL